MSEQEKKQRRLERNRESARECRARKKAKVTQLHQQLAKLETDNLQLRLQLTTPASQQAQQQAKQTPAAFAMPLEQMINQGASEKEIQGTIKELQERYSDYGRDRRSAFSFHLSQLKRCLVPTQTTRTMLFLMRCAVRFLTPDGEINYEAAKVPRSPAAAQQAAGATGTSAATGADAEIIQLLASLLAVIQPTREQRKQLVSLTSIYSGAPQTVDFSDEIIQRLGILVADKNELLDSEMSNISSILSPTQVAKFLVWVEKNALTIQVLESLFLTPTS